MSNIFAQSILATILFFAPTVALAQLQPVSASCGKDLVRKLGNGGALAVTAEGETVFAHRADEHFIPASTLKVATVAAALDAWGPTHRFSTEFYLTADSKLVIRGLGDPGLVSEDMPAMAAAIAKATKQVNGFVIDESYFSPTIAVDGVGGTTNPYDAVNGALLVNFNTVNVRKDRAGVVHSAEPQTPLTPVAAAIGKTIKSGTESRVNLGSDRKLGVRYFSELLTAFLKKQGVTVQTAVSLGSVPKDAKRIYTHHSSKPLQEHARQLLEYSTNFLANQLFLLLGAKRYGPPATIEKGRKALSEFLSAKVNWKEFEIYEGAGLSRKNQVSPRQMIELLRGFSKNRSLLAVEEKYFQAKTGSLRNVSTLAGFFDIPGRGTILFAILINDSVERNQRFTAAKALRNCLL